MEDIVFPRLYLPPFQLITTNLNVNNNQKLFEDMWRVPISNDTSQFLL